MKQFSLVTYLEGTVKEEVRAIQEKIFELTGSRECLDSWSPHLTVGSGILVSEDDLVQAEQYLENLAMNQSSFEIKLKGFGGFTNRIGGKGEFTTPFVLWIDVEVSDKLRKLVELIETKVTSKFGLWYQMPQPYTPHVTVAFRDLSEGGYEGGKKYLEEINFSGSVDMSHIGLVERQPTSDVEYKRFKFGRPT